MNEKSKVYIRLDSRGNVISCDGGYTIGNIEDFTGWILLDEGEGDRYNLCQSNYFVGGLYTDDGIPRYKYVDGVAELRTETEIESDRAAIPMPEPEPTAAELKAKVAELETAIDLLISGATEG